MKRVALSVVMACGISLAGDTQAGASERTRSLATARGPLSSSASGGRSGGTYGRTTTGPAGGSVTRSGSVSARR